MELRGVSLWSHQESINQKNGESRNPSVGPPTQSSMICHLKSNADALILFGSEFMDLEGRQILGSFIHTWQQEKHCADATLAAVPQHPPSLSEGIFHEGQLGLTCAHKAMDSWCMYLFFFSCSETRPFLFLALMAKQCSLVSQENHFSITDAP